MYPQLMFKANLLKLSNFFHRNFQFLVLKNFSVFRNVISSQYQEAPLHVAAYKGDIDTVNLLLQNNADINIKDKVGRYNLHSVCFNYAHVTN